ncbi:MAG: SDR family NAD(P)-dependent oxidoreductase [Bauldia sp.]
MAKRGHGTIVNLSSALAILHNANSATYSATKAFVLTLTQALSLDPGLAGIRFQAVLPGATRTEIWAKSGIPLANLPQEILMDTDEMVDAALAGLDQGELVTIPSLPDTAEWDRYEAARQSLSRFVSRDQAAARYRPAA